MRGLGVITDDGKVCRLGKYHSRQMKKTAQPSRAARVARTSDQPQEGFAYSRAQFQGLVEQALAHARRLGATDAGAEASEGCGLSVSVRKGALETVERNRDKSLGVTVYVGNRRGHANTSDFSPEAVERTVHAAYDIARFTAEDPLAGLPDPDLIAHEQRDLDLFHPWAISSAQAAELALRCKREIK